MKRKVTYNYLPRIGVSPSGKAQRFDRCSRWSESNHPSHIGRFQQNFISPCKTDVVGSNPTPTRFVGIAQLVERVLIRPEH